MVSFHLLCLTLCSLQGYGGSGYGGSGYGITRGGGGSIQSAGWGHSSRSPSQSPVMGSRERDRGRADGGAVQSEPLREERGRGGRGAVTCDVRLESSFNHEIRSPFIMIIKVTCTCNTIVHQTARLCTMNN